MNAAPGTEAPSPDSQRITVLLAALMRGVTADDLGFEPAAVPDHIEVALSLDMIMPQLATGRVEVGVEDLRQGVAERLRPAFAKMRPGLRFQVPLTEIFKYLSPGAIPVPQTAPHVPIITSPFQTPFALKADEDTQNAPPTLPDLVTAGPPPPASDAIPSFPVPPAFTSTPRTKSAPIMLPPPSAPPLAAPEPAPSFSLPPAPGLPAAAPGAAAIKLPGMPTMPGMPALPKLSGGAKPSAFSRPPGAPPTPDTPPASPLPPFAAAPAKLPTAPGGETHDDLGQSFQAGTLRAEPPSLAQAKGPFNPSSLFSAPPAEPPAAPAPRPAPVAVAAPAPAAPSAPPIEFNFGETPDMVRVTLRALFDSENDLTLHEIVERLAKLPGLRSAIAITGGGPISSGRDSGHEEVVQFRNSAAKSHEYLAGLAESMGYGSSGSFTLRAGSSVRTFFIENGNCLAVLHANSTFAPGVREKLIITSRLLRDLAD